MACRKDGNTIMPDVPVGDVPDLTVSLVSSDNIELLLPCLRSVFEATHHVTLEVFLVDNASSEPLAAVIEQEFPHVQVLRNEQRLGFSSNNNMVLKRGRGRYLMLLNDDTLVLDGALDTLVEFMDKTPQAGVVGSFLQNPDGSFQPAFARFPRPLREAIYPSTNWAHWGRAQATIPFEVDSVCGAALLVRREVFEQVGGLDPAFDPIYSEEVDWCYRIKSAGWRIFTVPQSQIIHYGSYTMNRVVPQKYELLLSHKFYFFRKHKGERAALVYRSVLWLTTLVKVGWWAALSLVRPRCEQCKGKTHLHVYLLKRIPAF